MLLPSDRHRGADLKLWSELERADETHYHLARVGEKAEAAVELIRAFVAELAAYGAISWGKDSVVVAHLLWRVGGIPCGRVNQTGHGADPYAADVRDYFLQRWPLDYHEIEVPLEAIPDDGGHSPALDVGIKRMQQRFGTKRYVGGVRADESGVRSIGMRTRGLSTKNTCQPIGKWSTADVFGYCRHHGLPVHPSYAMLGGGRWDRAQIRVSTIGGPKGNQYGRAEWEREFYGDVLRRLEAASV